MIQYHFKEPIKLMKINKNRKRAVEPPAQVSAATKNNINKYFSAQYLFQRINYDCVPAFSFETFLLAPDPGNLIWLHAALQHCSHESIRVCTTTTKIQNKTVIFLRANFFLPRSPTQIIRVSVWMQMLLTVIYIQCIIFGRMAFYSCQPSANR